MKVQKRFLRACQVTEHPLAIGEWIQQRAMWAEAAAGESVTCPLLSDLGVPNYF